MSTVATTIAREPAKVIGDILAAEMGLIAGQVMLEWEKDFIPENKGLFIALWDLGGSVIGSVNRTDMSLPEPTEIQSVTMRHMIQIDIMSFNGEARVRKEEVPMALRSLQAEQVMGENLLQVAPMPSEMIPSTDVEITKGLNRYTMTIAVTALHQKVKAAPYYSDFSRAVPPKIKENQ